MAGFVWSARPGVGLAFEEAELRADGLCAGRARVLPRFELHLMLALRRVFEPMFHGRKWTDGSAGSGRTRKRWSTPCAIQTTRPARLEVLHHLFNCARHPRSFHKQVVRS